MARASAPEAASASLSRAARLDLPHFRIAAAGAHQFGMGATLDDAAMVHDRDLVRMHHGGEAVRDQQRGAVLRQAHQLGPIACSVRESSAEVASSKTGMGGFFSSVRDRHALLLATR